MHACRIKSDFFSTLELKRAMCSIFLHTYAIHFECVFTVIISKLLFKMSSMSYLGINGVLKLFLNNKVLRFQR